MPRPHRRRAHKPPAAEGAVMTAPPEAPDTPDITFRNRQALIAELEAEAVTSETAAEKANAEAEQRRAESEDHARKAGAAAAEEMRLLDELDKARTQREHHDQQKDIKANEARQYARHAQSLDDRAADRRAAIKVVRDALPDDDGQTPDPTADTRMDEALARIEEARRTELSPEQREEDNAL